MWNVVDKYENHVISIKMINNSKVCQTKNMIIVYWKMSFDVSIKQMQNLFVIYCEGVPICLRIT